MEEGRYDSLVDLTAGAIMAGAVGFCLFTGWMPGEAGIAGGGSLLAFAGTFGVMRKVGSVEAQDADDEEEFVPEALDFAPEAEDETFEPVAEEFDDEVEVASADPAPAMSEDGELVLDDIVAELEPQSRVVRLFAPEPVVDPAELKARVDRHLAGEPAEAVEERELLARKPDLPDEAVDATNRLAAALDRVRQRLD